MMMRFIFFGLVFLLCRFDVYAQKDYLYYKNKYKAETYVYLLKSRKYNINISKNDELEISSENFVRRLFLNKKAGYYSDDEIAYSGFYDLLDISAFTQILEKDKYKKIKVKEFNEEKLISDDVFYDDISKVKFYYPSLREDAVSNLNYKFRLKEPRLLKSFIFQEYRPIINAELIIEADEDVNVGFLRFNIDTFDIQYSEKKEKGKHIYTFRAKNVNKFERESNMNDYLYYVPHIIPYIESYTKNDSTVFLLKDVNRLYNWYEKLISKTDTSNTEDLKKKSREIVSGIDDEFEKMKRIFRWVQKNIKYIAEEDGLGGFIPDAPSNVFKKKYGDCKGKSFLLLKMLEAVNVKSYLTWVGTNSLPYKYEQNPTPNVDNHIIVTYISPDGKDYFLDATDENIPVGMPTSFIQGKEALVGMGNTYVIKTIPVCPSKKNRMTDSLSLQIDGNNLIGNGKAVFKGYMYVRNKDHYDNELNTDKRKERYNSYLKKGNNKFIVNEFHEKIDEKNSTFTINYNFHIGDYIIKADNEIFINMNLFKDILADKIKKTDKYDKYFDDRFSTDNYYTLNIPNGWKTEFIPENANFDNGKYKYNITYTKKDNRILYHFYIEYDALKLTKDEFYLYNNLVKNLNKSFKQTLSLIKEN